jgi:hypothetical protein
MAFAGLLVSCSNGSGTEEIIFRGNESNEYLYTVSGTLVETTATGDKTATVTTTTKTTEFGGTAVLKWNASDDKAYDYQNYELTVKPGKAKVTNSTSYSGTVGKTLTQPKDSYEDYTDGRYPYLFTWYSGLHSTYSTSGNFSLNFYSLADKYFNGSIDEENLTTAALTADQEKAIGKDEGTIAVAVTGNIAEDDSLTIVYTVIENEESADDTVDTETTVYTFKLTKVGSAE